MRLSLKNMIISFALSLIVFSLIMTAICVSIYHSNVAVRFSDNGKQIAASLLSQTGRYDFSETVLYYAQDESSQFRHAVLVGIDTDQQIITLTPISAQLPVYYKDRIYYVRTIYDEQSSGMFPDFIKALTGIVPNYERDVGQLGLFEADSIDDFYAQIREAEIASHEGYTVLRIDVQLDGHGIADNQKTIRQFFITETK